MKFREDGPRRSASSEDPWGACKKALAGPLGTEIKEMMRAATEANEIADGPIKTPTGRNTARRMLADSLQRVAATLLASVETPRGRAETAKRIVANLKEQGFKASARDDHSWHTIFVDDKSTGALIGTVQVYDSGRAKAHVPSGYLERINRAIDA